MNEDGVALVENGQATAPPPYEPEPEPEPVDCENSSLGLLVIFIGTSFLCVVWYQYALPNSLHLFMAPIEHFNSFKQETCDVINPHITDLQVRTGSADTDINKACVMTLWSPSVNKSIDYAYLRKPFTSMAYMRSECNNLVTMKCWVSRERKNVAKFRRRHSNKIFWSFLLLLSVVIINVLIATRAFFAFCHLSDKLWNRN